MRKALILLVFVCVALAGAGSAWATLIQEDFDGFTAGPGVPTGWFDASKQPASGWEVVDLGGNKVLRGISVAAPPQADAIAGPSSATGWFVENFEMQVSMLIESGDGGGVAMGQFDGVSYTGNSYYILVSAAAGAVGLYEEGLSAGSNTLRERFAPDVTVNYGQWYDLRMVSTGTTFQVWFRPSSTQPWDASQKIIDVPQDLLHPGHKSYVEGWAACWASDGDGSRPASTTLFDDFRFEALPFPAAEDFSDDFENAAFSLANWSQHWCVLDFPTLGGSQVARITTGPDTGGIGVGQAKQYYAHNFVVHTSVYVDESFCGQALGVLWGWKGGPEDSAVEISRQPASTVPAVADDNFDDGVLDQILWEVLGTQAATIEERDGKIIVTFRSEETGALMAAGISTKFLFTGPFDVQVDYQLLNWPPANGFRAGMIDRKSVV